MEDLIAVLRPEIEQRARGEPFAFFGHSMGALLSYELTRALRSAGGPMPSRLFVAATSAPHARIVRPSLHTWPDAEMWQELTRFGGVPPTFLQDPELRAMMTPIIRADLELCHTYEWDDGAPLDVPISVFAGADDPHTSLASVREWRRHTTADFTVRVFAGGHFFIAAALTEVSATIAHDLSCAGERAHTGRLVR
jgi:surfactin synthase thioesterase subunit